MWALLKETYRSKEIVERIDSTNAQHFKRCCSTAIYYLLPKGTKSHLHRLTSDEVWHFYLGGPLKLSQLFLDGSIEEMNSF